jgi:hypothetical protein
MTKTFLRLLLLWSFLLALVGCNQADMLQKFATPADQTLAKSYIDLLRQQRLDDIEKAADPSIAGPRLHGMLAQMAAFMPAGEPTSITLVGAHRSVTDDATTVNLTFEYEFSGKWVLTNVAVKHVGNSASVVGFSVIPQSKPLAEQNRFTLTGKTPLQYAVLALAVVLPLFTLFALVVCIRTPLKGRKWPWVVFIVVGFGNLSMGWTNGHWAVAPLTVQLFSASAFAPLYGPWTLTVAIPLGAILFLAMRRRLRVYTPA